LAHSTPIQEEGGDHLIDPQSDLQPAVIYAALF
jgi:hypothetical protein